MVTMSRAVSPDRATAAVRTKDAHDNTQSQRRKYRRHPVKLRYRSEEHATTSLPLRKRFRVNGLANLLARFRNCSTKAGRPLSDSRPLDVQSCASDVREHVHVWRTLLTTHVSDGRQLLRELIVDPLRFTPEGRAYRFEGEAAGGSGTGNRTPI